jgi:hypothetical protein
LCILPWQHPISTADEHDIGTEGVVRACELSSGDARPTTIKYVRQHGQVVDLLSGQDAFAVGKRRGKHPGPGARGEQDDVCRDGLLHTVRGRRRYGVPAVEASG